MSGMLCRAAIGAPHAGQAERGTTRLNRCGAPSAGTVAAAASPEDCAHCSRQLRSSITGRRWITTLRKLPTTSPSARQVPVNTAGEDARSSIAVMVVSTLSDASNENAARCAALPGARRAGRSSDHRSELEDRQVHRDHEASDQYAEEDRKSTRLNSSHTVISYAVFCLKK